jgi:Gpi18-like mannosyltransferase
VRKLLAILLLISILAVPAAALAEGDATEGDDLLYNGDFSVYADSADLPAGWELSAYYSDAESVLATFETGDDGVTAVVLTNLVANDSRACQTVAVEANTCYRLSAEIRTTAVEYGTGANLSIDNYGVDGTYCYSENLFGTEAWRTVSLYVQTGVEQTSINVALRLGGYGTTATGTAEYRNVMLYKCTSTDAVVVDLATENGTISGAGGSAEAAEEAEAASANGMLYLALLITVAFALGYVWLYQKYLRYDGETLETPERPRFAFAIMLMAAFVIRLLLSLLFFGHPTDIQCFMAWGNMVLNDGTSAFYTSGAFADYPPGYMYVCAGLAWVARVFGISYGTNAMAFLFKLPATIAELFGAYFIYKIAKNNAASEKSALTLSGLFLFAPVLMYVSGAWGQIDSVLAFLLVLSIYLFQKDKRIAAGALYGLAILIKPQALMLGPLFAAIYIIDIIDAKQDWKKHLLQTVLAVLSAFAVLYVLALPFEGTQPWYWLAQKYASTASSYHYMSIEAFNLGSLLGGNWKSADTLVFGVPFYIVGMAGIVLSSAFSIVLYVFGRKHGKGAPYLCGAVLTLLIFTLGHYMHERYMIPALMLLLMAYLYFKDRRLLVAFGGIGMTALLNVTCAMYVVNHQAARGALYNVITFIGSLSTVIFAAYLSYVAVKILIQGNRKPALAPETTETEGKDDGEGLPAKKHKRNRDAVLPKLPTDNKLRYTKRDIIYVLAVTFIYGIVALTNLGSLKAPQAYWYSETPGETITVRFDQSQHVTAYSVYGNIDRDGTLLITADGGFEEMFEQTYDDMFRWKKVTTDFTADEVTLSLYSGTLKLNEMAFFNEDGEQIPVTVVEATGTQANLFDEQDVVEYTPSYYNGMYFDELYHARTAYEHLNDLSPYENSHPPLGKLFIMVGVWIFGMVPFGWRVVGALFGVGMLPILYAFGKRIFKNSNYALVLTTLFAFDFMHFTQTRIATIDVYSVFFILLMYYYMYQYITMNIFVDGLKKTLKPLALSGLFFGIGAACKWTSIYSGVGRAVLLFGSLIARYSDYQQIRAEGTDAEKAKTEDFWPLAIKTLLWCCLFFVAVPVAIYFASYTPYYIYAAGQQTSYGFRDMLDTFWNYQNFMYSYHSTLNATHPYQSSWYSWPFTLKPMWYYFNSYISATGEVSTLSASGNPAVWWVSSIGAVVLLGLRLTKKIRPDRALQIFFVGVLANYLPWVLVSRCTFIYHFFATVPFILMATVYLLQKLEQTYGKDAAFIKWVWVGFALLFFILLYPGLSGLAVSSDWAAFIAKLPGGKLMYGA